MRKASKADKLLVSQINVGEKNRARLSAELPAATSRNKWLAKKVVVITNLAPAKLRGVESQGMILAGMGDDQIEVLSVEKLPVGSDCPISEEPELDENK